MRDILPLYTLKQSGTSRFDLCISATLPFSAAAFGFSAYFGCHFAILGCHFDFLSARFNYATLLKKREVALA